MKNSAHVDFKTVVATTKCTLLIISYQCTCQDYFQLKVSLITVSFLFNTHTKYNAN